MKLNPGTICLHLKHFLLCINCRCICGNSIIIIIIILISQHQPDLSDQQPHQMIIIIFISNDFNLINSWGKAKPLWMWRWPQRGRMSSVTRWWSMIMVMILMMMMIVVEDDNNYHRLSSPLAVPTSSSYSLRTRVRLFDNSNELLTLDQGNSN